jgi:hypothetical protein
LPKSFRGVALSPPEEKTCRKNFPYVRIEKKRKREEKVLCMKELALNDRDVFALSKVLSTALERAEWCFEGTRHARMVTLRLQQYVEQRLQEEGANYEEQLKVNL